MDKIFRDYPDDHISKLQEMFASGTDKSKIIDFMIAEDAAAEKDASLPIEFWPESRLPGPLHCMRKNYRAVFIGGGKIQIIETVRYI